jgi:hypothetical protein
VYFQCALSMGRVWTKGTFGTLFPFRMSLHVSDEVWLWGGLLGTESAGEGSLSGVCADVDI